jgi:tetratricopeptide (TPR) repeat protein
MFGVRGGGARVTLEPFGGMMRFNEALGYELLGDREKAHALATELRAEFPHTVRLLTIWVRTAPATVAFDSLASVAAPFVKDDEELNLALAHRAFLDDRFDDALPYARRATELGPDSPHAWFVLGQAKHSGGFKGRQVIHKAVLVEAAQHYDRAIQLARAQKLPGLEAAIRFERGKIRYLLGDGRAEADYQAAVELARPDQGIRTGYIGFLLEQDRYADALRELAALQGEPTTARIFYEAAALYGRNEGDDRKRAHDLMRKILQSDREERWADAHELFVQWAVESKTQAEARAVIAGTRLSETDPLVYHTLCGWLSDSEGDREAAKIAFRTALNAVTSASPQQQVYLLAQALVSVGEDALALPLLERCYRPGVFDAECRKLLDCARRLQRHDVTISICRELRGRAADDQPLAPVLPARC